MRRYWVNYCFRADSTNCQDSSGYNLLKGCLARDMAHSCSRMHTLLFQDTLRVKGSRYRKRTRVMDRISLSSSSLPTTQAQLSVETTPAKNGQRGRAPCFSAFSAPPPFLSSSCLPLLSFTLCAKGFCGSTRVSLKGEGIEPPTAWTGIRSATAAPTLQKF